MWVSKDRDEVNVGGEEEEESLITAAPVSSNRWNFTSSPLPVSNTPLGDCWPYTWTWEASHNSFTFIFYRWKNSGW